MKGKKFLSISIAAALLLMNTASPAFAIENTKDVSVIRALPATDIQTSKSASSVKAAVTSTAAEPYTLTADDVNVERCREDEQNSDSPYIDAVKIVGWKADASLPQYKNIVIPETLPFDVPEVDKDGNVITKKVEMPVIMAFLNPGESYRSNLEKVTFSKNLRFLVDGFYGCENLSEVVIPEDSDLEELGVFYNTAIREIYIPAGVTKIKDGYDAYEGWGVFELCKNLKTVRFAENSKLKIIGARAFLSSGLTSINLPSTVEEIHDKAFSGCCLEEFSLSDIIEEIPSNAFSYCNSLKTVSFGSNLKTIGYNAFAETALTKIVIPDSVTLLGRDAFSHITTLKSVTIGSGIKELSACFIGSNNISDLNLSEGLEYIGAAVFRDTKITELTIPSTVRHICGEAFAECKELEELNFTEGSQLELISSTEGDGSGMNDGAFAGCISLKSLKLPVSTTPFTLDDYTFERCSGLRDIDLGNCRILGTTLKNSYNHFGGKVFAGCSSLRSVNFGECLEQIALSCFYGCTRLTGPIVFPDSLRIIGDSAFESCSSIEDVTFNEGLEQIGYDETWCGGSFSGCDLHEIILPDSVKEVGNYCFRGNLHVQKIKFSANMTVIPDGFLDNYAQKAAAYSVSHGSNTDVGVHGMMKKLIIPDNIREIGYDAFDGCLDLEYLDLGKVEYIGTGAFSCHNLLLDELELKHASLKTVIMSPKLKEIGTRPPHTEYTEDRGDVGNMETSYFGVFDGQGDFEGLVLPNTLEKVGKYAFVGCPAIKEFNMTENLKSVDDHAFDGCQNLNKVTFAPTAKTKFGDAVFFGCTSLTEIKLPSWLEVVPVQMFSGCKKLSGVIFPEGIETLSSGAFGDTALNSVELPESCLYIDDSVFQNAPVTSVKFGSKTISIGNNVFVQDTNLHMMTSVYIPESVKSVGEKAFGYYKDTPYTYDELCREAERLGTNVQNLISPTIANNDFILYGGTAAKRYADENGMIYGGTDPADMPDPKSENTYGDLDGDGNITSADSLLILRASVKLEEFDQTKTKLADVDGDGSITSGDSLEVLRYSVKLPANENIGKHMK